MKFSEIYTSVMNKCNVDTDDDQAIKVIKDGINVGYKEITKESKLISTVNITPTNKLITLPDDIIEILKVTPVLDGEDQLVGNNIITNKEYEFTIVYSYTPDSLTKDNDEPELPTKFHDLLIDYGCYIYYQFKKKDTAREFYNSYRTSLTNMVTNNLGQNSVRAVYSLW
ncbi:MAG: hypothetical protein K0S61_692 [Anaerocolumna sp.]|jgi:hypothetical protein|nr:hypothetical protein [Anaerocolumna sp.]